MDYATAKELNDALLIMRSFWTVFFAVSSVWCFSSIIIEFVKMYTFKEDTKEIFRSIFNIIKTIVYIIPMGMMTLIVSAVNNNGINLDMVVKISIVVVAFIAVLISIIYKWCTRKDVENINKEDKEDEEN